ncbi:MAG TPA: hypothetical protein VGB79_08225 [Allosphingosinicella sp.]
MHPELTAALLAAAQAAAAAPVMLAPERPQIVVPRALEGCTEAAGSEIVVCGRRDADARHRLTESVPAPNIDAPRNVMGLQISENVRAEIDPVQYQLPNGMIARGLVARVRIAF